MKIIFSCIREYLDILLVKKKNENDLITIIKVCELDQVPMCE